MRKLQDRPYGICRVCGKIRKVRLDGTMIAHGPKTGPPFEKGVNRTRHNSSHECDGNWLPPLKLVEGSVY